MWANLANTATLPALASLSRVFLGPIVPGWVDEQGHVRLPLHMDASEVSLEISHDDTPSLRAWHRQNEAYFASRIPDIGLFGSKEEFENEMRPVWLKNAGMRLQTTLESYLPTISGSARLSPIARILKERGGAVRDILSACLYIGPGYQTEGSYCLVPQDLTLYGDELTPEQGLFPFFRLIETAAHVETLIRSGMTDVIFVTDATKIRRLHDSVSGWALPDKHRPNCFYEADEEGHIEPLRLNDAMFPDDHHFLQASRIRENQILLGCFLFAELRLGEDDFSFLSNRLNGGLANLMEDRTPAIVLKHLGASALTGPEAPLMARFLASAVREAGLISRRD